MDLTTITQLLLAVIGLAACLLLLPFAIKRLDQRVRENITIGVYVLLISYVAAYYVIRPLSAIFGNNIWF
jgi:hypothetical protein